MDEEFAVGGICSQMWWRWHCFSLFFWCFLKPAGKFAPFKLNVCLTGTFLLVTVFFVVVLSKSLITSVILKLCIISCSFPGKAEADGSMHVTLCDYIMLWDSLSATQKKSLSQRYQMGCDCKVRPQKAIWVCLVYLPGWKENGSRYLEVESRHNRQKEPMFYPLPSGIWFRLSTFSLFLHQ